MPIGKMPELDDFGKKFSNMLDDIKEMNEGMSLDALLENYGEKLDKIILDEERDKKCSYISGEFKISALDEKNYQCSYALYFEDANESIHTSEAKTKPLEMKFLTEDFKQSLNREKVLKFEIEEPSTEIRAKYQRRSS